MSIEIYAFSDRRSMAAWQAAIDAEGFDLVLDQQRPFEQLRGYLPARRGDRQAGFECDHFDPAEIIESAPDIDFGRRWAHVLVPVRRRLFRTLGRLCGSGRLRPRDRRDRIRWRVR